MEFAPTRGLILILTGAYLIASGLGFPIPIPPTSVMIGSLLVYLGCSTLFKAKRKVT